MQKLTTSIETCPPQYNLAAASKVVLVGACLVHTGWSGCRPENSIYLVGRSGTTCLRLIKPEGVAERTIWIDLVLKSHLSVRVEPAACLECTGQVWPSDAAAGGLGCWSSIFVSLFPFISMLVALLWVPLSLRRAGCFGADWRARDLCSY
jgi:hypothetical protein